MRMDDSPAAADAISSSDINLSVPEGCQTFRTLAFSYPISFSYIFLLLEMFVNFLEKNLLKKKKLPSFKKRLVKLQTHR